MKQLHLGEVCEVQIHQKLVSESMTVENREGDIPKRDALEGSSVPEGKTASIEGEEKPLSGNQGLWNEIVKNIENIEAGFREKDRNKIVNPSRFNKSIRSRMNQRILHSLISGFFSESSLDKAVLIAYVEGIKLDVDMNQDSESDFEANRPVSLSQSLHASVEINAYLALLLIEFLIDHEAFSEVAKLTTDVIQWADSQNRRSLDSFTAKIYFFFSLCHEKIGQLSSIRGKLLSLYRSACLKHDEPGQAMLINLILRNYLECGLYSQADHFVMNTQFPENHSNYQYARYLYYMSKIKSIQLKYSDAYDFVSQSLRRSPQLSATGFRQSANKLFVLIQLLMGDIPERSTFFAKGLRRALKPYFQLTQAVRIGDLHQFTSIQNGYKDSFIRDGTFNLILRLRHNVIKTALRKISLSYSRISIEDIASRLGLDSTADAEYVIAKSIHDGVMDAVIDRRNQFVFSKENVDVYGSEEPQHAYHRRIKFCLGIHNEAVKAMRYPEETELSKETQEIEEFLDEEINIDLDMDEDDFMD